MPANGPESGHQPSEKYDVHFSPGARRALSEDLPESVAFAAYEFIKGSLSDNPYRVGAALREPFRGLYRARRGEYRIRYSTDEKKRRIIIFTIDHRRDAYRS